MSNLDPFTAYLNGPLKSNQENDPYGDGDDDISFVVGQFVKVVGGSDYIRQTGRRFGIVTGFKSSSNSMELPPVSFQVNLCAPTHSACTFQPSDLVPYKWRYYAQTAMFIIGALVYRKGSNHIFDDALVGRVVEVNDDGTAKVVWFDPFCEPTIENRENVQMFFMEPYPEYHEQDGHIRRGISDESATMIRGPPKMGNFA